MDEKNKMVKSKLVEIFATAGVAGLIAVVQNLLTQSGIDCGPNIDPMSTSAIGAGLSSVKIAIAKIANVPIS